MNKKTLIKVDDLLENSGYVVDWDKDRFTARCRVAEGEKGLISDANSMIKSYKGNFIKDFNKFFGYNY